MVKCDKVFIGDLMVLLTFYPWFFTWCGLNCDQAAGEAPIGFSGIHKNSSWFLEFVSIYF